jgi:putative redox protein
MISKTQTVEFVNQEGHILTAKLEFPPDRKPFAFAIFAHCFVCNNNGIAARNISQTLASRGIGVLRFDFSGRGESEGAFVKSGFATNISDILAAAAFLEVNFSPASILIGHGLGGTAILFASSELPAIKCIVTIGSPADPARLNHIVTEALAQLGKKKEAEVKVGGQTFNVSEHFLKDLLNADFAQKLRKMRKAILIMHAPFDKMVDIENAKWLYEATLHPKSFISLDGADHILSHQGDSIYVGEIVASWASRYLAIEPEKALESELQVVASLQPDHHYTTLIKAGDHYLTADEPESVGGDNFGPSPYQLLSASLGACTAMTLRMYANRKNWDPGEIRIHLKHDKMYITDQGESIKEAGESGQKMDVIDRIVELSGILTETQRQRLLEIANRCPVHRTLEKSVRINTRLKSQD